jgi:hypothetical protein
MSHFNRLNDEYGVGKILGSGMQGEVFEGLHYKSNSAVALKFVDKSSLDQKALKMLEREVSLDNKY